MVNLLSDQAKADYGGFWHLSDVIFIVGNLRGSSEAQPSITEVHQSFISFLLV